MVLLWCFLTNSVEEHDNIQIINSLIPVEFTIKIADHYTGDYFLCYLAGVSRFIGVLEVTSEAFRDASPIWEEKSFPVGYT